MKKVFVLLSILIFTQASAGILKNRATKEEIKFTFDQEAGVVDFDMKGEPYNIDLKRIYVDKEYKYAEEYFPMTDRWVQNEVGGSYFMAYFPLPLPPVLAITLLANTADLIFVAPFKLIDTVAKNAKYNKDYRKLIKSIKTDKTVKVTNNRFKRIRGMLLHVKN